MTKQEMKERFEHLTEMAVESREDHKMRLLGKAQREMFEALMDSSPMMAEKWIEKLEPICWNNWLSGAEALEICASLRNQDGSSGAHWPYDTFINAVKSLGGVIEQKPEYNSYALWAVANMIYSDHANSIATDMGYKTSGEVPNERIALSCYLKAVELLSDADGRFSVREYFEDEL